MTVKEIRDYADRLPDAIWVGAEPPTFADIAAASKLIDQAASLLRVLADVREHVEKELAMFREIGSRLRTPEERHGSLVLTCIYALTPIERLLIDRAEAKGE